MQSERGNTHVSRKNFKKDLGHTVNASEIFSISTSKKLGEICHYQIGRCGMLSDLFRFLEEGKLHLIARNSRC